jgi:NACHT domain- and WD repeat-containing protein
LNAIFKHDKPIQNVTQRENLFEIRDKFLKQLSMISVYYPEKKIYIFLDSIESLSRRDCSFDWLFLELPQNCKVLFSLQIDFENLFEIIKNKLSCIVIDNLDQNEARTMLEMLLEASNRQLSTRQWHSIEDLFMLAKEIYPLHVKLIFDISSKWLFTDEVTEDFLKCVNIKDTIKYLFKNFENQFGETLFSRCVFYITIFEYRGISESELQDILSIDDDVLNSIFKTYHPLVRRFPLALWLNIKYELKIYLIEHEIDGVVTFSW